MPLSSMVWSTARWRSGRRTNRSVPADRVLIGVRAAGVCGSDVHLWRNHQSWEINLPLVLGHEFSGEVVAVGSDVDGVAPGDRVTCETAAKVCGRCSYCLGGAYNLCPHRLGYGALIDGAFTDIVVARPEILHPLPDAVSWEHASLTEPGCVAYNALVEKTDVRAGDLVVVQGPGPIGIMALQIARIQGAGTLVVLGTGADQARLDIAAELGADHVVNIEEEDPHAPGSLPGRRLWSRFGGGLHRPLRRAAVRHGDGAPQWSDHEDRLGTATA